MAAQDPVERRRVERLGGLDLGYDRAELAEVRLGVEAEARAPDTPSPEPAPWIERPSSS
jgi:hypothetical protein